METGLEGKPWWVSAIIAGVLVLLFPIIGYKAKFENMKKDVGRREGTLNTLEQKINEGRAAERSLPQFREEVRRLELELDKLLRILPSRRKTDDLLRRIRALTEQGDINLLRFGPRGEQPVSDFYSEWAIDIQLEAGYHRLALLFDRITRFSRIINIENLRITPLRVGHHTIRANFTAKTFLYNDPETEEDL